jgi:hypothetical protein
MELDTAAFSTPGSIDDTKLEAVEVAVAVPAESMSVAAPVVADGSLDASHTVTEPAK